MSDLYRVPSQKTYLGKTAGGWLKHAGICETRAGTWEVFLTVPQCNETYIIMQDEDGDMVLAPNGGLPVVLETSHRAADTLRRMVLDADRRMMAALRKKGCEI